MSSPPDRSKQRREYLRRKSLANLSVAATGLFGCFAVIIVMSVVMNLVYVGLPGGSALWYFGVLAVIGAPSLVLMAVMYRLIIQVEKTAAIPYVSPVSERLAHAPAEEILLRSSGELPGTHQEGLLRPAGTVESRGEELLRVAIANDDPHDVGHAP